MFCRVILNMYVIVSAVYVLQMFCFIRLHFDILLSIVTKATEWKTLLEDICQKNEIHMDLWIQSESNSCLFVHRERLNQTAL